MQPKAPGLASEIDNTRSAMRRVAKNQNDGVCWFIVREIHTKDFVRFGDDLLSHVLRRSTIGATVLNCRVRDGAGCFTRAMITKPNKRLETRYNFQVSSYCTVCMTYLVPSIGQMSVYYWIKSSLSDH